VKKGWKKANESRSGVTSSIGEMINGEKGKTAVKGRGKGVPRTPVIQLEFRKQSEQEHG